ncbi:hypothetical protein ACI76V_07125 [Capnocytophaga cynodegmi]
MLKKIIVCLLISLLTFVVVVFLSFQFLIWLHPPKVIIDGQIRYTMPLGQAILSFIIGTIGALVTFISCFWRNKK